MNGAFVPPPPPSPAAWPPLSAPHVPADVWIHSRAAFSNAGRSWQAVWPPKATGSRAVMSWGRGDVSRAHEAKGDEWELGAAGRGMGMEMGCSRAAKLRLWQGDLSTE